MARGNFNKGPDHGGFKHGMINTPTYRSWISMKSRCNNPNAPDYYRYGGRGIKICEEWDKFDQFYEDMGERPDGTTLDRIDNNGDYSPENCKWSTSKEQTRNRRDTNLITIEGETKCFKDWCEHYKIPRSTVTNRVKRKGMSFQEALTT